jgi:hypothetical protein
MYALVKKTESHKTDGESNLEPMKAVFESHITAQGNAAVEKVKNTAVQEGIIILKIHLLDIQVEFYFCRCFTHHSIYS